MSKLFSRAVGLFDRESIRVKSRRFPFDAEVAIVRHSELQKP